MVTVPHQQTGGPFYCNLKVNLEVTINYTDMHRLMKPYEITIPKDEYKLHIKYIKSLCVTCDQTYGLWYMKL